MVRLEGFLRQATKQMPQRRPGDWAFQRASKSTSAAWFVPCWVGFNGCLRDSFWSWKTKHYPLSHCHCKWKVFMLMTTTPFNYSILVLGPTIQTARIKLHAGSVHPAGDPFHSGPQQQVLVRIQCKWVTYCDRQSKAKRTRVARRFCRTVLENSVEPSLRGRWRKIFIIGFVCCDCRAPPPCGFFLFCCVVLFSLAGAHRNGCLQKEGPEAQVFCCRAEWARIGKSQTETQGSLQLPNDWLWLRFCFLKINDL